MEDFSSYNVIVERGVSFGSVLAITISFTKNRSILWACLAGLLSWFYVIYAALTQNYRK